MEYVFNVAAQFILDALTSLFQMLSAFVSSAFGFYGTNTLHTFFSVLPVLKSAFGIFKFFGYFIVLFLTVIGLINSMAGELTSRPESPVKIVFRAVIFIIAVSFSQQICTLFFVGATSPYAIVTSSSNGVLFSSLSSTGATELKAGLSSLLDMIGSIASSFVSGSPFAATIILLIKGAACFGLVWSFMQVAFSIVEKYVFMGFLATISPLTIATGVTETSSETSKRWFMTMLSQTINLLFAVFFMNVGLMSIINVKSVLGDKSNPLNIVTTSNNSASWLLYYIIIIAWLSLGLDFEDILNGLGLSAIKANTNSVMKTINLGENKLHQYGSKVSNGISQFGNFAKGFSNIKNAGKKVEGGSSAGIKAAKTSVGKTSNVAAAATAGFVTNKESDNAASPANKKGDSKVEDVKLRQASDSNIQAQNMKASDKNTDGLSAQKNSEKPDNKAQTSIQNKPSGSLTKGASGSGFTTNFSPDFFDQAKKAQSSENAQKAKTSQPDSILRDKDGNMSKSQIGTPSKDVKPNSPTNPTDRFDYDWYNKNKDSLNPLERIGVELGKSFEEQSEPAKIFDVLTTVIPGVGLAGKGIEALSKAGKIEKGISSGSKAIEAAGDLSKASKGLNAAGDISKIFKGVGNIGRSAGKAAEGFNTMRSTIGNAGKALEQSGSQFGRIEKAFNTLGKAGNVLDNLADLSSRFDNSSSSDDSSAPLVIESSGNIAPRSFRTEAMIDDAVKEAYDEGVETGESVEDSNDPIIRDCGIMDGIKIGLVQGQNGSYTYSISGENGIDSQVSMSHVQPSADEAYTEVADGNGGIWYATATGPSSADVLSGFIGTSSPENGVVGEDPFVSNALLSSNPGLDFVSSAESSPVLVPSICPQGFSMDSGSHLANNFVQVQMPNGSPRYVGANQAFTINASNPEDGQIYSIESALDDNGMDLKATTPIFYSNNGTIELFDKDSGMDLPEEYFFPQDGVDGPIVSNKTVTHVVRDGVQRYDINNTPNSVGDYIHADDGQTLIPIEEVLSNESNFVTPQTDCSGSYVGAVNSNNIISFAEGIPCENGLSMDGQGRIPLADGEILDNGESLIDTLPPNMASYMRDRDNPNIIGQLCPDSFDSNGRLRLFTQMPDNTYSEDPQGDYVLASHGLYLHADENLTSYASALGTFAPISNPEVYDWRADDNLEQGYALMIDGAMRNEQGELDRDGNYFYGLDTRGQKKLYCVKSEGDASLFYGCPSVAMYHSCAKVYGPKTESEYFEMSTNEKLGQDDSFVNIQGAFYHVNAKDGFDGDAVKTYDMDSSGHFYGATNGKYVCVDTPDEKHKMIKTNAEDSQKLFKVRRTKGDCIVDKDGNLNISGASVKNNHNGTLDMTTADGSQYSLYAASVWKPEGVTDEDHNDFPYIRYNHMKYWIVRNKQTSVKGVKPHEILSGSEASDIFESDKRIFAYPRSKGSTHFETVQGLTCKEFKESPDALFVKTREGSLRPVNLDDYKDGSVFYRQCLKDSSSQYVAANGFDKAGHQIHDIEFVYDVGSIDAEKDDEGRIDVLSDTINPDGSINAKVLLNKDLYEEPFVKCPKFEKDGVVFWVLNAKKTTAGKVDFLNTVNIKKKNNSFKQKIKKLLQK